MSTLCKLHESYHDDYRSSALRTATTFPFSFWRDLVNDPVYVLHEGPSTKTDDQIILRKFHTAEPLGFTLPLSSTIILYLSRYQSARSGAHIDFRPAGCQSRPVVQVAASAVPHIEHVSTEHDSPSVTGKFLNSSIQARQ